MGDFYQSTTETKTVIPADVPRFVQVTCLVGDSKFRHAIDVRLIDYVVSAGVGENKLAVIYGKDYAEWTDILEPIDVILSRIREVTEGGKCVSSYEEPKT